MLLKTDNKIFLDNIFQLFSTFFIYFLRDTLKNNYTNIYVYNN